MKVRRLADRGALLTCAATIAAALAWVTLHPHVAGMLQAATVGICLTWRLWLHRPHAHA